MEWITKKKSIFPKKGVPADRKWEWETECKERSNCLDKNNIREQHTLFWLFCWKDCTRHSYLFGIAQDCMHSSPVRRAACTRQPAKPNEQTTMTTTEKTKNCISIHIFWLLGDKSCSFTNPMPCSNKIKSTKNCSLPFCFPFVKRRQPLPLYIRTASKKLLARLWCAVAHLHFSIVFDFAVLFVICAINPFARQVCVCQFDCMQFSCASVSIGFLHSLGGVRSQSFYSEHVSSLIPLHFSYLGLSFLPLSVLVYCIRSGLSSYNPAMIFTFFLHTTRLLFLPLFFDQFFILCFLKSRFASCIPNQAIAMHKT